MPAEPGLPPVPPAGSPPYEPPHGDGDLETRSRSNWRRNAAIAGGVLAAATAACLLAGKGCDGDKGRSSVQPGVDTSKVQPDKKTLDDKEIPLKHRVVRGDNLTNITKHYFTPADLQNIMQQQHVPYNGLEGAITWMCNEIAGKNWNTFADNRAVMSTAQYNALPAGKRPVIVATRGSNYVVQMADGRIDAGNGSYLHVGDELVIPYKFQKVPASAAQTAPQGYANTQAAHAYAAQAPSARYRTAAHVVKGGAQTVAKKAPGVPTAAPAENLAVAAPKDTSIADVVNDTTKVGLPPNVVYFDPTGVQSVNYDPGKNRLDINYQRKDKADPKADSLGVDNAHNINMHAKPMRLDVTGVKSVRYNAGKNRVEVQYHGDKAEPKADSLGIANAQLIHLQRTNPALYQTVMAGKK